MLSWLEESFNYCRHLLSCDEQHKLRLKKSTEQQTYFLKLLWAMFRKLQAIFYLKFNKKKKLKFKKYKRKIIIEENEPFETEENSCRVPEYYFHRYLEDSANLSDVPAHLLFAYPRLADKVNNNVSYQPSTQTNQAKARLRP